VLGFALLCSAWRDVDGHNLRDPKYSRDAATPWRARAFLQCWLLGMLRGYGSARMQPTDGVSAEEALWRGQSGSHLVSRELSRIIWGLCVFRSSLQSRITTSAKPVCQPEDQQDRG